MTSREQFEQFVLKLGYPAGYLNRLGDGYSDGDIQSRWIWWRASRAALVVELPPVKLAKHAGTEWISATAKQEYQAECRDALEAIGVRVTQ